MPHMISWADTERDLTAWLGNAMQSNALLETYKLERPIKERYGAALKAVKANTKDTSRTEGTGRGRVPPRRLAAS